MNNLNFFLGLTNKSATHSHLYTSSSQSGGQSFLRPSRILFLLFAFLTLGVGNVWGAEGDVIKEFDCNVSSTNSYARQTPTCDGITWNVSWGQTSYIGTNKSSNYGNLKITNSTDLNAGKAVNASITTTTQGYCAIIPQSTMANVGKITISCSDLKGSPAVYVVSSTSLSTAYTQITLKTGSGLAAQGATLTTDGLTFEFDKKASGTYYAIVFYSTSWYRLTSTDLQFIEGATASCSNSVALSKGTATNGTINSISSASVETCGDAASRQVTVTITPADCFDAPSTLNWTKSSGTVSASKQSGPTDNGDGTYSYVYQFAQNDNGAGTFGVTCTAKAAGKTVNFNAGPGSCGTSSLTETCDGSGVTLPAVTATGVCKGWTTFAGWATSAVSDSTTTSGVTLYAAGSKFVPASNGQTLYAVYSKVKGGGGNVFTKVTSEPSDWSGTYLIVNSDDDHAMSSDFYDTGEFDSESVSPSSNQITCTDNKLIWIVEKGTGDHSSHYSIKNKSTSTYAEITGTSSTNAALNASKVWFSIAYYSQSGKCDVQSVTNSGRIFSYYSSNSSFRTYSNSSLYTGFLYSQPSSTTYYCSDPNCCTPLGAINGSIDSRQVRAVVQTD